VNWAKERGGLLVASWTRLLLRQPRRARSGRACPQRERKNAVREWFQQIAAIPREPKNRTFYRKRGV